jgi:isopentenyl-diphosphate delta-isomerase
MEQMVVLVDEKDRELDREEKLKAHQNGGKLHRAISVLVFNSKGGVMLQRRALTKYHAAGLWANTTCSHPMPGESVIATGHRRLKEEMGFDCDMREAFTFIYKADVGSGLTEYEYDHVLFGNYDGEPRINTSEVMDWKWMSLKEIKEEMEIIPEKYAPWFRLMIDRAMKES